MTLPIRSFSPLCAVLSLGLIWLSPGAGAQVVVKKENIENKLYPFQVAGPDMENVGGAMESSENVAFTVWNYPEGPQQGSSIYYTYADGKAGSQTASIVLKWDFSESGSLVAEAELPHNRLYYQYEASSTITEAIATISYSTDGKTWTELDQFTPEVSALTPEAPVKVQDNPLYVVLDKPSATFYYRVQFEVKGGSPFYGQAFQWERMSEEAGMVPNYFSANFTVVPTP